MEAHACWLEVADLDAMTPQKAPPIGMRQRPEFIAAIAKWKDEFIIVPNTDFELR